MCYNNYINEINKFMSDIKQYITDKYNYDENKIAQIVDNSVLNSLLESDCEICLRYPIDYWGDFVVEEYIITNNSK